MEKPWLSVIVPSHNGERWLAAALQSVADQKDNGIEVIVVDGSAIDASLEIVKSFSDKLLIRAQRRCDLEIFGRQRPISVSSRPGPIEFAFCIRTICGYRTGVPNSGNGFPLNPTVSCICIPATSLTNPRSGWGSGTAHYRLAKFQCRRIS